MGRNYKFAFLCILALVIVLHAAPYMQYGTLYSYDDQAHYKISKDILETRHVIADNLITGSYIQFPGFQIFMSVISLVTKMDIEISGLFITEISVLLLVVFVGLLAKTLFGNDKTTLTLLSMFFVTTAPYLAFRSTFRVPQTFGFAIFIILIYTFYQLLKTNNKNYATVFLMFCSCLVITHHLSAVLSAIALLVILVTWEIQNKTRHLLGSTILFLFILLTVLEFTSSPLMISLLNKFEKLSGFDMPLSMLYIVITILFIFNEFIPYISNIISSKKNSVDIGIIINRLRRLLKENVALNYIILLVILFALITWIIASIFFIDNLFVKRWIIDKIDFYIITFLFFFGALSTKHGKVVPILFSTICIFLLIFVGKLALPTLLMPHRIMLFYFIISMPIASFGFYILYTHIETSLTKNKYIFKGILGLLIVLMAFVTPLAMSAQYESTSSNRPSYYYADELFASRYIYNNVFHKTCTANIATDDRGAYILVREGEYVSWDTFELFYDMIEGRIDMVYYFLTSSMLHETKCEGSVFTSEKRAKLKTIDIDNPIMDLIYASKNSRIYHGNAEGSIPSIIESD